MKSCHSCHGLIVLRQMRPTGFSRLKVGQKGTHDNHETCVDLDNVGSENWSSVCARQAIPRMLSAASFVLPTGRQVDARLLEVNFLLILGGFLDKRVASAGFLVAIFVH